ncbi:hypothetical protein IAQ61_002566 [Plenodomus lingam]|uniref:uncharacterized protein n=1 Tax=Leptosphaeria maculans TaxID=5022 RepID=UPI0033291608|nr:hypothetical protein IAQ61_002566 [Plenodomus lingam]
MLCASVACLTSPSSIVRNVRQTYVQDAARYVTAPKSLHKLHQLTPRSEDVDTLRLTPNPTAIILTMLTLDAAADSTRALRPKQ